MTFEQISKLAQQGGTIYFTVIFVVAVVWVFLPSNKSMFDRAARLPLEDGDDQ